uniref:Major capsid protein n=1 Tax=Siphoviridae sp. ct3z32 TaxID=2825327 RepID=A0A8S5VHZ1_9CAUD|nr:MAG TPA: Major capsid protein [Siphoviridae sp. ct3z32]
MVKSVLQKSLSQSNVSRNAFDVGYSNKFTSSLGMLLPCFVRECNPDEHYVINARMFTRTMPMNSAAFIQCTQHVEFFFVPYRLLWRDFPQFVTGTKYPTSLYDTKVSSDSPKFDLAKIYNAFKAKLTASNATPAGGLGTDLLGYPKIQNALRLLDLLGYGCYFTPDAKDFAPAAMNPFRLLAYQKICADFYRVANWEDNRVKSWNIDGLNIDLTSTWNAVTLQNFLDNYLALNYRPWKKDLFTIANTQFQGADFLSNSFNSPIFPQFNNDNGFVPETSISGGKQGELYVKSAGSTSFLTMANLRSAFALDKLYRLMALASDGDYKSQIKARYGFDAYAPQMRCQFVGSASSVIQVNPITSTADTLTTTDNAFSGTPVGRIYGNGVAQGSDTFEFDTKEHGILMGICSFVPDVDYSSYGVNIFNKKLSSSEYFQPEFDNLGKQALDATSLYLAKVPGAGGIQSPAVLGWIPRYAEYKTHIDEVHGQLNGNIYRSASGEPTLSSWTAPRLAGFEDDKASYWCKDGLSKNFFYINPALYNSIFVNQYEGFQTQDQFICEVSNNVQALLPMSVSGEPLI